MGNSGGRVVGRADGRSEAIGHGDEGLCDHEGGGYTAGFQQDCVVQTARRAGASIADA